MTLWWIGALALLLVVFPVVLILLSRILAPVERIRAAADEILDNGVVLASELDNVPALLARTDKTIKEVAVGAVRYAGSVQHLLHS
ncbi:hypothetical protein C3Y87_13620 [Carbonactinospora thermoautotrophica]|uniref:Uncharacterized protein n=1 Tax=Carbonactinospora thermoautotrophica TaxID=1469144 RepID=A0A132ND67_9ACTN|nr:hypothetical protein [Carbonactinospora thermoautotrophica]KWX05479.1 hypothetical protein TH66_01960 [Carbonactinospora thermoautotrophica]KWX08043.1 hypothetical protein TR74_16680 [Carbonactinospora thermoautotrophica]MCX9192432.1 hypothetical protein [Carbonactinospora thermoautotrophica]